MADRVEKEAEPRAQEASDRINSEAKNLAKVCLLTKGMAQHSWIMHGWQGGCTLYSRLKAEYSACQYTLWALLMLLQEHGDAQRLLWGPDVAAAFTAHNVLAHGAVGPGQSMASQDWGFYA